MISNNTYFFQYFTKNTKFFLFFSQNQFTTLCNSFYGQILQCCLQILQFPLNFRPIYCIVIYRNKEGTVILGLIFNCPFYYFLDRPYPWTGWISRVYFRPSSLQLIQRPKIPYSLVDNLISISKSNKYKLRHFPKNIQVQGLLYTDPF